MRKYTKLQSGQVQYKSSRPTKGNMVKRKKTAQRRSTMAKKYPAEDREQADKLAREIGNRATADRLDIHIIN